MRKRKQKRAQSLSREIYACFVVIHSGKGGWCFENNQVCAFARYLSVKAAGRRIGTFGPLLPFTQEPMPHLNFVEADMAKKNFVLPCIAWVCSGVSMNTEQILTRIRAMFDVPVMQNNLRGLWVELMIAEILGPDWKQVGNDWAPWDLERSDGFRVEVKQSASTQSWGNSTTSPRFSIAAAKAYYPDGKTYTPNRGGGRLANLYIFAWHEGGDQRIASEWRFFVIRAEQLPRQQKSIGLNALRKLTAEVSAEDLRVKVAHMAA